MRRVGLGLLGAALLTWTVLAHVEVFVGTTAPTSLAWNASATVTYRINSLPVTSLPNVVPGSNVTLAIDQAFLEIGSATDLTLVNGGTTATQSAGNDGVNLVTFANTVTNAALSNGTVAVTVFTYNTSTLRLIDADLIFGSSNTFSTLGTSSAFDVRAVATHEAGHFVGQDHSPLTHATMFPFTTPGRSEASTLEADDVAGLHTLYPGAALPSEGTVSGTVVRSGVPVLGAHVVLEDVITGRAVTGGVTFSNGTFTVRAVPEGLYRIYAEPLDGPMEGNALIAPTFAAGVDTQFRTTWSGGSIDPTRWRVRGGQTTAVGSISVPTGAATIDITTVTFSTSPTTFSGASSRAAPVTPPFSGFLVVGGPGIQTLPDSAFSLRGAFVSLGGISTQSGLFTSGEGYKIFPVTVPTGTPPGGYSVRVVHPITGHEALMGGAIDVLSPQSPTGFTVRYGPSFGVGVPPLLLSGLGPPVAGNAAFGLQVIGTSSSQTLSYLFSFGPEWTPIPGFSGALLVDVFDLVLPLPGIQQMATGSLTNFPAPVPNSPAISGLELFVQVVAQGSGGTLAVSNGLLIHYQ